MKVSQACIDLIKHFEGLSTKAYRCTSGVLTIGYGHTAKVKEGDVITEKQAEQLLKSDLTQVAKKIDSALTADEIEINQNQFDALCSFAFNVGFGALLDSKLWAKLKDGDLQGAAKEFSKWIYDNGKKLKGLELRRQAERRLFEAPIAE